MRRIPAYRTLAIPAPAGRHLITTARPKTSLSLTHFVHCRLSSSLHTPREATAFRQTRACDEPTLYALTTLHSRRRSAQCPRRGRHRPRQTAIEMVVYTNASSPKRRRTDDAQATAQQIIDTNAALRMFTSNKQNRWMHMQNLQTTSRGEEGATGTPGNSGPQDNVQACDALPRPHDNIQQTNAQPSRPPALNVNTQSAPAPPDLVNYESPYTTQFPTPMTAAAALQSRPPSASTPHPSLPSPAPSEEHANSPGSGIVLPDKQGPSLQAHVAPAKRGPGRPRKYPVDVHTVNQAPARSPIVGPRVTAAPNTISQLPANMRIHTPTSNLAPSHSRSNSLTSTANVAVSPHRHTMRSQSQRRNNAGGLFGASRMQQRLDEYFKPREQILNPIDQGRKILLQEAIQKDDFFYLILSQVFCLYTCDRQSMPKQLGRVGHLSWIFLEKLLCSNKAMSPLVVSWFASFPAPVHIIFASGESQFYLNQLVIIESFLQELPRRWDSMIDVSKRMLAPPLTQDMVEELYLISPIVQTTAFRAIARIFWNGGEDSPGLQFLETLHKMDQETYTYRQWRRNKSERGAAYGIYAYVHTVWQQSRMLPGVSEKEFVLPHARDFFRQPPPSMQQASDVGTNGQFSRGDAQKMQLIEMNNRILAQRQPVPGLSADQSRTLLQSSNRPAAPQGLPPNPLQHLQYQPMQPHPGHLINPPVIPCNGNAARPNRNMPPMSAYQPLMQTPNHLIRLLPPANAPARPLPVQPDTARVSLHQAHLRSPVPGNRQLLAGAQPLYRHVTGYALPPTRLDNKLCAQSITLSVSRADIHNVPTTMPGLLPGEPGVRTLQEGSILYRLRCCKMPPGKGFDTEASWVTAGIMWPDIFTFKLNDTFLEPRRKLHHGRCLPIDLSSLLHAGDNTLSVYTIPNPSETGSYVVAVERVSVSSHDTIVSAVTHISADDSLTAIKRSLESPPDEDDDIAMTSSTLTIPLFEPYRNDRICDTPVRGSACLHRECFDLETFLSQCKREQPGYPCVPDCWRCPICKGDVRPQTLVKDGFLVQVKEQLAQEGLLDTRAIIVEENGSWKPRVEAQPTGVRSASLEIEEAAAASATMAAAANSSISIAPGAQGKKRVVEVIELD